MYYVGLFFSGITQSWGGKNSSSINRGSPRTTETIPTKSAIIGIINAALGVKRGEETSSALKGMRILTRTDIKGTIIQDYQIAQRNHHGYTAGSTKEIPKENLEESIFITLLGFQTKEHAQKIAQALQRPHWSLFSGRRSNVFTLPICLGIKETQNPREFLQTLPLVWEPNVKEKQVTITDTVTESPKDKKTIFEDEQLSNNIKDRNYGLREINVITITVQRDNLSTARLTDQYLEMKEEFNVFN